MSMGTHVRFRGNTSFFQRLFLARVMTIKKSAPEPVSVENSTLLDHLSTFPCVIARLTGFKVKAANLVSLRHMK